MLTVPTGHTLRLSRSILIRLTLIQRLKSLILYTFLIQGTFQAILSESFANPNRRQTILVEIREFSSSPNIPPKCINFIQ